MSRRFAGAGLMRRGGREGLISGGPSLAGLGASLLHHWEVPVASSPLITLNGSNISQLNDRVGTAHLTQGTAGNQPSYSASGGPNGRPCVTFQDVNRLISAALSTPAANRVGYYIVCAFAGVDSRTIISGSAVLQLYRGAGDHESNTFFTGGGQVLSVVQTDTNWQLSSFLPYSTGAKRQRDGANTTPNFSGSDTLVAETGFGWGHIGTSAGSIAMAAMVDAITPAKDAIVKAYVRARYGMTIA